MFASLGNKEKMCPSRPSRNLSRNFIEPECVLKLKYLNPQDASFYPTYRGITLSQVLSKVCSMRIKKKYNAI